MINERGWRKTCVNKLINIYLMKNYLYQTKGCIKTLLLALFSSPLFLFAQDTTYSTSTTVNSESLWYLQPWVWVVGGVILLLLLIALFSGGSKKNKNTSRTDKVIITKTVRTETDVDE